MSNTRRRSHIKTRESFSGNVGVKGRRAGFEAPRGARRDSLHMESAENYFDASDEEGSGGDSASSEDSDSDSFAAAHGKAGAESSSEETPDEKSSDHDDDGSDDGNPGFDDDDLNPVDEDADTEPEDKAPPRRGRSASTTPKKATPRKTTPKKKSPAAKGRKSRKSTEEDEEQGDASDDDDEGEGDGDSDAGGMDDTGGDSSDESDTEVDASEAESKGGKSKGKSKGKSQGKATSKKAQPKSSAKGTGKAKSWSRRETFARQKAALLPDFDEDSGEHQTRSKRKRVAPVAFWRNERIAYGVDPVTHTLEAKGIIPGTREPTPKKRKLPLRTVSKKSEKETVVKEEPGLRKAERRSPEKPRKDIVFETIKEKIPVEKKRAGATIWTGSEEQDGVVIGVGPSGMQWYTFGGPSSPSRKDGKKKKPSGPPPRRKIRPGEKWEYAKIAKNYEAEAFTSGFISVPPGKNTPEQDPGEEINTFHVMRGYASVHVYRGKFSLGPGSSFYIPAYNCYKIRNLSHDQDLVLGFTTIKSTDDDDDEDSSE